MNAISETEIAFVAALIILGFGILLVRVNVSVIEKRVRMLWRLEAKLDLLLQHAGIEFDPYKNLPREVIDAMQRGERIRAMKYYRDASEPA